jgi:hypothetical protein
MIRSIAAALAAFALISFSAVAEETPAAGDAAKAPAKAKKGKKGKKAPKADAAKTDAAAPAATK